MNCLCIGVPGWQHCNLPLQCPDREVYWRHSLGARASPLPCPSHPFPLLFPLPLLFFLVYPLLTEPTLKKTPKPFPSPSPTVVITYPFSLHTARMSCSVPPLFIYLVYSDYIFYNGCDCLVLCLYSACTILG